MLRRERASSRLTNRCVYGNFLRSMCARLVVCLCVSSHDDDDNNLPSPEYTCLLLVEQAVVILVHQREVPEVLLRTFLSWIPQTNKRRQNKNYDEGNRERRLVGTHTSRWGSATWNRP